LLSLQFEAEIVSEVYQDLVILWWCDLP